MSGHPIDLIAVNINDVEISTTFLRFLLPCFIVAQIVFATDTVIHIGKVKQLFLYH